MLIVCMRSALLRSPDGWRWFKLSSSQLFKGAARTTSFGPSSSSYDGTITKQFTTMSAAANSIYTRSMREPEAFWKEQAELVHWHKKPSRSFVKTKRRLPDGTEHDSWQWFPDGEISTAYNCLDRHVLAGNGDTAAIIWESPVTGKTETWSYKAVLHEVEVLAGVLREEGVQRGDMVLIYSE